jgi:hypothetical protein
MEIKASNRSISRQRMLYLSGVSVRVNGEAHLLPIDSILGPQRLVTVRFPSLAIFDVAKRAPTDDSLQNGNRVFIALFEAMVERGVDVLEHPGSTIDGPSSQVFRGGLVLGRKSARSSRRVREALQRGGAIAKRLTLARDVRLGVQRTASFVSEAGGEG